MARTCPRCSTGLEPRSVTNDTFAITVDDCKDCGGLFLDRGELARLAPDSASVEELTSQLSREPEAGKHDIACPHCTGQMHLTSIPEPEVQLDICGGCKGIWFDQNELEALQKVGDRDAAHREADSAPGLSLLTDIVQILTSVL
ncbi:MAG: zf-TFIIB domain-containing protein [Candidatus Poseidoniia archaeon]|jgi:Zn-finger nucleic acid-binding protein|nr:zf-TFIIB domain-containing protein [Candidatus Poseidoniia archaeon]